MNEERINQIKEQIRQMVALITAEGEEPPEDIQDLLLQVIDKSRIQIQQLRNQSVENAASELPETTPPLPPGPHGPGLEQAMPSSNIEGFAYDDKTGRLLIRFLGKYPDRNGPIYGYEGVPPNIFQIFRRGAVPAKTNGRNKWGEWWQGKYPSIGAAMYHVIRAGGYPYQRLT